MNRDLRMLDLQLSNAVNEAYKALRANVQFCMLKKDIKTIAITSYNPGEGKTTTSINLAVAMAKIGVSVLYVDADLRKATTSKYIKGDTSVGLTNFILGHIPLIGAIYHTNINGLDFTPCGIRSSNPGELICSSKFGEFLLKVREQYEVIIIDTPPLGCVIDSAVIAAQTDGTIIVSEFGALKGHSAKAMKEQLEVANANILGVVFNKYVKKHTNYYGANDYYGR